MYGRSIQWSLSHRWKNDRGRRGSQWHASPPFSHPLLQFALSSLFLFSRTVDLYLTVFLLSKYTTSFLVQVTSTLGMPCWSPEPVILMVKAKVWIQKDYVEPSYSQLQKIAQIQGNRSTNQISSSRRYWKLWFSIL